MILEGSVSIITGASSGFGKALALRLVQKGGFVVLGDLNNQGEQVAQELNALRPNSAVFEYCNVLSKDELQNLFSVATSKFGKVDIVVNNAGIGEADPFVTNEHDTWELVVDIDLNAVILGTRLAIQEFSKQGSGGVVLNTASLAGLGPVALQPVYAAVKAGVVNFSRSLGYLWKERGVRVNAICPSFAKTALTAQAEKVGLQIRDWVTVDLVIDAFILAIEDDTMAGEAIRITPKHGIDFPFRRSKL
jgi:NAD(P)-dependent dehydrogenase (short-subunit alcohol dehydrogenase family)